MQLKHITTCSVLGIMCLLWSHGIARQGAYLDLSLGRANQANKGTITQILDHLSGESTSSKMELLNLNYVWTLGGDLGYQINHYLGVEGGGFVFQNGTIHAKDNLPPNGDIMKSGDQIEFKSWLAYLAMKARTPLLKMFDMYAKLGAGYQAESTNSATNPEAANSVGRFINNRWAPVLSMGIENRLSQSLRLRLQYMYVPSNWLKNTSSANNINHSIKPKNIYTLSLGYYFSP